MLRRHLPLAVAIGTMLVLATLLVGASMIRHFTRQTAWRAAEAAVGHAAGIAETVVNRHLLQVDGALASLPALLAATAPEASGEIVPARAERLLRSLNFQTFAFRDLAVIGADGRVWAAARRQDRALPVPSADIVLQKLVTPGTSTVIGPFRDEDTGDWMLHLVRAIELPGHGRLFALAEIPVSFLTTPLAALAALPGIEVRLQRPNGQVLASLPHDDDRLGRIAPAADDTIVERRPTVYADLDIELVGDGAAALADWARNRNRLTVTLGLAVIALLGFSTALILALRRQERLEAERIEAQGRLEDAVAAMSDGFVMWDADDRLVTCNEHFRELYAESAAFIAPGVPFEDIIRKGAENGQYPQAGDDIDGFVRRTVEWHRDGRGSIERLLPDGRWLLVTERRTANGGAVGIRTDITRLKQALDELAVANDRVRETMAELQHQNVLFDAALNNMPHGLLMVDADGRVIVCNRRFADLFGLDPAGDLHGRPLDALVADAVAAGRLPAETVAEIDRRQRQMDRRRESGTFVAGGARASLAVTQRPLAEGGFVATYEDVTEKQETEQRIRFLAHHDPVTGLPNRILFRSTVETKLGSLGAGDGGLALLCLDLDKFKDVNDTMGHPTGDALLAAVAERLRGCLRRSDIVARLGGDEFAVALSGRRMTAKVRAVCERIIREIGRPYAIGDRTVTIGVSIGAAIAADASVDADALLKNADMALYESKARGRATYSIFRPDIAARLHARLALESDLREAVEQHRFELAYQPLFDLKTDRVTGFEALLRWHHPERGTIPPSDFIPIAEETGLIHALGADCLRRACRDAAALPAAIKVAVNLSPVQLKSEALVQTVFDALRDAELAPTRLELEITESALLEDDQRILEHLHRLRAAGVSIVLDDFGTGFSSLSHLRRFPFEKIKIDQIFVRDATTRPDCAAIVTSIVELAGRLGIGTTAEGIETQEQLDLVRRLGCTEGQGYLLGTPRSALGATEYLQARKTAGTTVVPLRRSARDQAGA